VAWVKLLAVEDTDGPAREMAESGVAQYGQLLNTWAAILNRPEIFAAYLPFLRAVAGPGTLDPKVKDMSAALVGWLNHCRYTVSHRAASSARNGVDEDDLRRVMAHDWTGFDAATQAALEFTEALTLLPAGTPYREAPTLIGDDLRQRLSERFTDAQIVELTMSVSIWNGLARFHRVMGFDLDMPVPPAGTDPAA
jgi:alkylhydroperoxidase family enzyme